MMTGKKFVEFMGCNLCIESPRGLILQNSFKDGGLIER